MLCRKAAKGSAILPHPVARPRYYCCLFRAMGQLAAWDKQGALSGVGLGLRPLVPGKKSGRSHVPAEPLTSSNSFRMTLVPRTTGCCLHVGKIGFRSLQRLLRSTRLRSTSTLGRSERPVGAATTVSHSDGPLFRFVGESFNMGRRLSMCSRRCCVSSFSKLVLCGSGTSEDGRSKPSKSKAKELRSPGRSCGTLLGPSAGSHWVEIGRVRNPATALPGCADS